MSPLALAVRKAFEDQGALARVGQSPAVRDAQAEMALAVADAIEGEAVLAVEAGTGVGKTWAYLAPLLMSGRKAWLCTATQALQEQLFQRDLPALSKALGLPVRAALLKGRSNYVCLQRLEMARGGALRTNAHDPAWVVGLERVQRWAMVSQAGDLAELPDLDERSPLRPWISSTRDNCLGDTCPRLATCHVARARRLASEADWVVINHHLFMAGLLGEGDALPALLPPTDVVVFDEAHRLVELGESVLGLAMGSDDLLSLARDMRSMGDLWARGMQAWAHHALVLEKAARSVFQLLGADQKVAGQSPWEGVAPKAVNGSAWLRVRMEVLQALAGATVALQSVADAAAVLSRLADRAQRLRDDWRSLVRDAPPGGAPGEDHVRWLEWGMEGVWRVARSAPDFAQTFQAAMAQAHGPRSWIFTSATLGTDAALSWFVSGMGLQGQPALRTLRIPSPFDHATQAALYVPEQLPEPADAGHSEALATLVADWAALLGGRTMVLTTSLRATERIAAALRGKLAPSSVRVLSQGQGSKRALLATFREAGPAGSGAVLVASASFWEGVDLAGDVLQLLVIDKLPFPSPGDPLTQVRSRRAQQQGADAFQTCYLDKAALALKQGAGRLIRSTTDLGVLVIADRRLLTQTYGAELLGALPDMPRLVDALEMRTTLVRLTLRR